MGDVIDMKKVFQLRKAKAMLQKLDGLTRLKGLNTDGFSALTFEASTRPMACSWCGKSNDAVVSLCWNCGHEAHKTRLDCTCTRCLSELHPFDDARR